MAPVSLLPNISGLSPTRIRAWIAGRIERAQAAVVEAAADNETLARAERAELESSTALPEPQSPATSRMRL
jgi:hypothetical protein